MSVLRLGYVHLRVVNLQEAKRHYEEIVGLSVTHQEPDRLYLKAWDEWDHHHLVLHEGGRGLVKFGFKVLGPDALEAIEKRVAAFGASVSRFHRGENLKVGEGIRCILPSDHVMEMYYDIDQVGTAVGPLNPQLRPLHLRGTGAERLDHMLITAENPAEVERFFLECLEFRVSERVVSELGPKGELIGSWMFSTHKSHDIAVIKGVNGKLHHIGYKLLDWNAVREAGILFGAHNVSVGFGPEIHGLSRGQTIYFFDPSGNRNEVFAGGLETARDFPTITWTSDQLLRAVGHIAREMKENHFTVVT